MTEEPIYDMQLRAAASKLRFTPGPWVWTPDNELGREGTNEGVVEMAEVSGHKMIVVPAADKALIAAAPELYAALHELLDYTRQLELANYASNEMVLEHPRVAKAVAALEKAEGREVQP